MQKSVQVDHTFEVRGVGSVVSGLVIRGRISVGDQLLLGPSEAGSFTAVDITCIQRCQVSVRQVELGQRATLAIHSPLFEAQTTAGEAAVIGESPLLHQFALGTQLIVIQNPVHNRTTRLGHPPVLLRGTTKLVYGQGVPAPWNSSTTPAPPQAPKPTVNGKEGANGNGNGNSKDDAAAAAAAKLLPDARLFATWNWEGKSYREPLPALRRGRMGSVAGTIHVGAAPNGIARRER